MLPFITQNNSSFLLKVEDNTCNDKNHSGGKRKSKKKPNLKNNPRNFCSSSTSKQVPASFKKLFLT